MNKNKNENENEKNEFNLINLDSCSLGSACDQQDSSLDCHCCLAGCPTSPNSLQKFKNCSECYQNNNKLDYHLLNSSNQFQFQNQFPFNQFQNQSSNQNFISPPSVTSTGLSINELDDFNSILQNHSNTPIDQEIVWINKELEELIKCCCCDQPTQSETLPLHHADAHPTHHVNFDMLFNPSINLNKKDPSNHQVQSILSNELNSDQEVNYQFKCQWKDCNLNFKDRLELTEHVNLCHLFQSTCINSNPLIQNCDHKDTTQVRSNPNANLITPHSNHLSKLSIPTSNFFNDQIDEFLFDSHSSSPSSFTHNALRLSPSIQSFSDQIITSSRQSNQQDLQSSNSSTLISKSSCDSIHNFFNPSSIQSRTLVSHNSDQHQLETVQENFLIPNSSPSLISPIESIITSQNKNEKLETNLHELASNNNTHPHVCYWESCTGKHFSSTAELTKHISNDHIGSGKSSYDCMWKNCFCDRESSRSIMKEKLQEEDRTMNKKLMDLDHVENVSFQSDIRKRKSFNQRQKIMRHLQTHTGDRPFECESCFKKFGEMATLVQHRRTHTQEKPYKCLIPGCGKLFALQSALTIHTRTHTGLKPFKCHIDGCKSEFSESSNLSKHLKIHSNFKKFSCHICLKKFTRSDQLQRHLKSDSIHQNLNLPSNKTLNQNPLISSTNTT